MNMTRKPRGAAPTGAESAARLCDRDSGASRWTSSRLRETGADFLSSRALTHSAPAANLSYLWRACGKRKLTTRAITQSC